jgi:hypothetical protein
MYLGTQPPVADDHLHIYLNDHLAGSTAGLELAKRARKSNEGTPLGDSLATLAHEIEADRDELQRLMDELDVPRDHVKAAGGYIAEKLGRLKLNGQLTGYSPLSRVVEMEALFLGVTGKRELWIALRDVFGPRLRDFDFDRLIERSESQRDRLEEHRLAAIREALGSSSVVKSWNATAAASS